MMRMRITWLNIGIFIFISCDFSRNLNKFRLPLEKETKWYYDVKLLRPKDKVDHTDFTRNMDDDFELLQDTIIVTIDSIVTKNKIEIIYFNKSLNKLWYKNIALYNNGYINYYSNKNNFGVIQEHDYIIKLPIKLDLNWEHRVTEGVLKYQYTNIDTSISIYNQSYNNCVELTAELKYHCQKGRCIKIYFNEKHGLVYYSDSQLNEEIKLIKMNIN